MADIKTIDLRDVPSPPWFSFLRAEWWDDTSRFVLVRYAREGKEQELGLRLDLDKKVFLDHMDDAESDKVLQTQAKEIWRVVAQKRAYLPDWPHLRT